MTGRAHLRSRRVLSAVLVGLLLLVTALYLRSRPNLPETYYLATTVQRPAGLPWVCAGTAMGPLILHGEVVNGDATTWAVDHAVPVYWPSGFTAQFTPELVVFDGGGHLVAREGDDMNSTPWHGLMVCPQGGRVEVWEPVPPTT